LRTCLSEMGPMDAFSAKIEASGPRIFPGSYTLHGKVRTGLMLTLWLECRASDYF